MLVDADAILQQALHDASKPRADGGTDLGDFLAAFHAISWLQALAAPQAFATLTRMPSAAHLLRIVDEFLLYARRGECGTTPTFHPVPYALREQRALVLRELLLGWTPPNLPAEVVHAAREVLEAEGLRPPNGWERLSLPPGSLDEYLSWPDSPDE